MNFKPGRGSVGMKQLILDSVSDLAKNLINYDRRDDEELPRGEIEKAIAAGEVTVEEIVTQFRAALMEELE